MEQADRWMIGLTGALAFFGLCGVIAAILQWTVMSGQLTEMRSGSKDTHTLAEAAVTQANAARTQAEQAISQTRNMSASVAEMQKESVVMRQAADASIAANRAWIVPVPVRMTQAQPSESPVVLHWQNSGKSPAVYVYGTAEYAFQYGLPKIYKFESRCESLQRQTRKKSIWTTETSLVLPDGTFDMTLANMPSEWKQSSGGGKIVSVLAYGCVWYTDVLSNRERTTEFCYEVDRTPIAGTESVTTIPCWFRRDHAPLLFH